MVQILSGLITYLLLAIYCHEQHGKPVSIRRIRQLHTQIRNEANLREDAEIALPEYRKKKTKHRLCGACIVRGYLQEFGLKDDSGLTLSRNSKIP